ncbi:HlyD family efflux transporter periplasmic adaptor subunit [Flammeovirga aprica]|uniref:HlyD family efflux transporter periplasmic adaptor subunit n=1 Tax=Flammeovirga aprica JL-4 TaxID=694437 RepID=A0A7X9NZS0_9BACT|nr:HlyD family efflux transporter periplasmic adaptor subunit [Flammeovirga aprica]NME66790.1 HlyD family efflux transporter periplasmic adaptor subunit [Flammeovirga aprica JL-4]
MNNVDQKNRDLDSLLSNESNDLMDTKPFWIVKYGNMFYGVFFLSMLILSAFVKYPEVILSEMLFISDNPPVKYLSKTDGIIDRLLYKNNSYVEKDKLIAIIGTNVNYKHILGLERILLNDNYDSLKLFDEVNLGSLQMPFNELKMAYAKANIPSTIQDKLHLNALKIKQYEDRNTILKTQYDLKQKDYLDLERKVGIDSNLYLKDFISYNEFQETKSNLRVAEISLLGLDESMNTNNLNITSIKNENILLEEEYEIKLKQLNIDLKNYTSQLISRILDWKKEHLLVSDKINGTVTYAKELKEYSPVKKGELLFYISNDTLKEELYGTSKIAIINSGKLEQYQTVNIKLRNYPYHEYGILKGEIVSISDYPILYNGEYYYDIKIGLPNSLVTTYGIQLPFISNMIADIEIVTEDYSFLERFFNPIKNIYNN